MSFLRDTGRYYELGTVVREGQTPPPKVLPAVVDAVRSTGMPLADQGTEVYKGWKIEPLMTLTAIIPGKAPGPKFAASREGENERITGMTKAEVRKEIDRRQPVEEKTPTQPMPTSEAVEKKAESEVKLTKKHLMIGGGIAAAVVGLLLLK